jgi:leucyl aminopeptidase (aminopeptidase T)
LPGIADYSPLAKEILETSLRVKSGDRVWVQTWDHAIDLATALAFECSSRALPCLVSIRDEKVWLRSIMQDSINQLRSPTSQEKAALGETDFYIFTLGPRRPVPWNSISCDKRSEVSIWLDTRYDKSTYAKKWARIAKANKVRMLAIEATLATLERAEAQGLDYDEWRDVMLRGCMADHKAIARRARKLAKFMQGKGKVSVTTSIGTHLTFDLARRSADVSDGISTNEMAEKGRVVFLPAGAIEVSVDEESAEGRVVYGLPVKLGNSVVEDLVLEMRGGVVVSHSATNGLDALERYLKEGGRDAAGFSYFGFGLNPNLRHGFTQDDKVLGGLTIGFGGNKSLGGKNPANGQWWASITKATVELDEETLMVEGSLLV